MLFENIVLCCGTVFEHYKVVLTRRMKRNTYKGEKITLFLGLRLENLKFHEFYSQIGDFLTLVLTGCIMRSGFRIAKVN